MRSLRHLAAAVMVSAASAALVVTMAAPAQADATSRAADQASFNVYNNNARFAANRHGAQTYTGYPVAANVAQYVAWVEQSRKANHRSARARFVVVPANGRAWTWHEIVAGYNMVQTYGWNAALAYCPAARKPLIKWTSR
jgi:hypothetical protein